MWPTLGRRRVRGGASWSSSPPQCAQYIRAAVGPGGRDCVPNFHDQSMTNPYASEEGE
jgi:hypothetical protein